MLDNKPLTNLRFFFDLRHHHYPPFYSISGIHTNVGEGEETDEIQVLLLGHEGGGSIVRIRTLAKCNAY